VRARQLMNSASERRRSPRRGVGGLEHHLPRPQPEVGSVGDLLKFGTEVFKSKAKGVGNSTV